MPPRSLVGTLLVFGLASVLAPSAARAAVRDDGTATDGRDDDDERSPTEALITARTGPTADTTHAAVETPLSARTWLYVDGTLVTWRAASDARTTYHPEIGAGLGFAISDAVTLYATGYAAPRSDGASSVTGEASAWIEDGGASSGRFGDGEALELTLGTTRYAIADAGAAGQHYALAYARWRPTRALLLEPRAEAFAYSGASTPDAGALLGAMTHDEVAAPRAPRWRVGARATLGDGWLVCPLAEVDRVGFADGEGSATDALGGLSLRLGRRAHAMLAGGVRLTRLDAPRTRGEATSSAGPIVALSLAAEL